jgi:putative pyruvate formate lyase activating enzyme
VVTTPRTGVEVSASVRTEGLRAAIEAAWEHLGACDLCAFECRADRLAGERGQCKAGTHPRVFAADVLLGEELCLCPSFGVRLSGCNLRCPYCNVWAWSQDPEAGEPLDGGRVAEAARLAQARGACNLHLMGGEPTIYLPTVLQVAAAMPPDLPLVLNTNLYWSAFTRDVLAEWVDVWVVDMRVGQPECCTALGAPTDYVEVARTSLLALGTEAKILLRHLALPGHIDCCAARVIEWAAESVPHAILSPWLRYFPPSPSQAPPELCRGLTVAEQRRLAALVAASGLRVEGRAWTDV